MSMGKHGGLPPPRIDQQAGTSRAGVGPAPSGGVVLARLVLIRGTGDGEFVYDTAGNLRYANVAATTKDPVRKITCQQGISTFNGHGAVISLQATALDAYLLYADTGTSAQGALIASEASAGGTDPFGNLFLAGVNAYLVVTGGQAGTYAVKLGDSIYSGDAAVTFNNLTNPPYTPPAVVGAASSVSGGTGMIARSGRTTIGSAEALLSVVDSVSAVGQLGAVAGQGLIILNAAAAFAFGVTLAEIAAPAAAADPQLFASNASGMLRFVSDTTHGDSNAYDTGKLHLFNTVAVAINSTSPVTILSAHVVAGTYEFSGIFRIKQGTVNQNQSIGFTGPAVSFVNWYQKASNQSSASMGPEFVQGALNLAPSIAFGAAGNEAYVEFRGTVTFTATGTFTMAAQNQVAGDTCTAQPGCIFDLEPVG